MNALEFADFIDAAVGESTETTKTLRRQHEAIVKLREALIELSGMYVVHHNAATRAKKALKDTEEFQ